MAYLIVVAVDNGEGEQLGSLPTMPLLYMIKNSKRLLLTRTALRTSAFSQSCTKLNDYDADQATTCQQTALAA